MSIKYVSIILAAIFLAIGLSSDVKAAFYDGTDTLISGSAPFYNSPAKLYGYVDYAVYSPGDFAFSDDKFTYCYQIFNSSTSSGIGRFTVNLNSDETAYSPGYFISSENDICPITEFISPSTVAYLFNSNYRITAGSNSSVLFFTSDSRPETNSIILTGATTGSLTFQIPPSTTTPEPASLLLFFMASPAVLRFRKRK